jgi:hypothetical protein
MKYLEKNWIYVFMFFVLLGCIFGGCDYNYAPEGDFVVNEIKQCRNSSTFCNYFIKDDDLVFCDSCGKWNIGDTITIKW